MARIEGIQSVLKMIRGAMDIKLKGLTAGLKDGGRLIARDSLKIVPVDQGNLKASWFIRSEGDNSRKVTVTVGYTAAYAIYVHENLDAAHGALFNMLYAKEIADAKKRKKLGTAAQTDLYYHSRGDNQMAKFLEKPFRDDMKDVMAIVVEAVK